MYDKSVSSFCLYSCIKILFQFVINRDRDERTDRLGKQYKQNEQKMLGALQRSYEHLDSISIMLPRKERKLSKERKFESLVHLSLEKMIEDGLCVSFYFISLYNRKAVTSPRFNSSRFSFIMLHVALVLLSLHEKVTHMIARLSVWLISSWKAHVILYNGIAAYFYQFA